ncbi:MAG TPA: hypothetical protein VLK33_22990 [Terriglobales bacterium]|nr:hypothetical protein [Terriglobales bacterium]
MRRFGLLGVLLVGLLSVTLLRPALAVDTTWTCFFDFSIGELGWSGVDQFGATTTYGSYWDGSSTTTAPDAGYFATTIGRTFTADLTSFTLQGYIDGSGAGSETNYKINGVGGSAVPADPGIFNRTFSASESGSIDLEVWVNVQHPQTSQIRQITLYGTGAIPTDLEEDGECSEGTTGRIRPLRLSDEYTARPLYDYDNAFRAVFGEDSLPDPSALLAAVPTIHRVTAVSNEAGAPVMVAQSGVVTDIVYASGNMCSVWGILFANQCWFVGPRLEANTFPLYAFDIAFEVQLVTVDLGDGTELRYMVANADHYVSLGQHVNAGCVIGETIQADSTKISDLNHEIASGALAVFPVLQTVLSHGEQPDFAVAFAELHEQPDAGPIELLDSLTEYNDDAEPCNINENFRDCLVSDPDLTHGADAWTFFGDASATAAGVELRPDSYIEQIINVPEDTAFTLRIGAYYDLLDLLGGGAATDRVLTVRVGAFSDTITIPASDQYQEFTVEVPTPDPDPNGLGWTVRIANTGGGGGVILTGACLTTEDHELNPRMCYFANPDFDSLQGWLSTTTQTGAGFVNMGDLDYVSQDVTLEANEDDTPRTYHLLLDVRVIAAPGETLDTSTGTATMFYAWEGTNTVGTLDLTWNQPGEPGYPDGYQTLSTDIVVTEHSSDTFYISSGIDGNDTIHIALSRACLSTDDIPPGSGVGGPFQTTCSTIPVPTDNEFGSWIQYHWRNLDKFFNCKLMVLLNKWFRLFDDFRRTTLLVFRWGIAFINKAVDWSITLMWWLNGHFRNIAMGQVTTITDGGGCHDIFCAIVDVTTTLGNLLTPIVAALNNVVNVLVGVFVGVVNLFFTIIGGLVAFVVALLIKLMSFIGIAISLLTGLVGAYNTSTPTAIPGLPSCAIDPSSSPFCYAVWVADNTFFSGRWNTLFNILLSVLAIHLILYTVREIKHIVLQTWSSS